MAPSGTNRLVVVRMDEQQQAIVPDAAPADILATAKLLKTTLKHRDGVFNGQRVEFFKGKRAVELLAKDDDNAEETVKALMEQHNFFFRVDKNPGKQLDICQDQFFSPDAYFVWQWDTRWNRIRSTVFSFGLLLLVFLVVLFPLWPMFLRTGVWYLSMTMVGLVGALLVLAVIRLILFVLSLLTPCTRPGLWIFPNLFADVGVIDSFIPFWGWHGIDYEQMHHDKYRQKHRKTKKKKGKSKGSEVDTDADDSLGLKKRKPKKSLQETTTDNNASSADDDDWEDEK